MGFTGTTILTPKLESPSSPMRTSKPWDYCRDGQWRGSAERLVEAREARHGLPATVGRS